MKKRPTEEQIVRILNEAANGKVAEVCRRYGISDATYYNWKKKYEGMSSSDLRRLRFLELLPAAVLVRDGHVARGGEEAGRGLRLWKFPDGRHQLPDTGLDHLHHGQGAEQSAQASREGEAGGSARAAPDNNDSASARAFVLSPLWAKASTSATRADA